jgi:hypothetical protein
MKKTTRLFLAALLGLLCTTVHAQVSVWPKEIPLKKTGGKVIIYQPQPDELNGNKLKGRAAMAGKEKPSDDMLYGALFFEASLNTDKGSRMATLESFRITNARVNGLDDDAKMKSLITLIETEVMKWNLDISLDQLRSTIKLNNPEAPVYNNTPPVIHYRTRPTTLVILDGEPRIQQDKNLDAERVVNSPNLIFKEGNVWNMYVGGVWYQSASVMSGWKPSSGMSKKVQSINTQIKKQEKESNGGKDPSGKPEATDIIVSSVPAELIQTTGDAQYKSIDSTSLQFVSNTKNDMLKDASGQIYILIAGRWYRSASFNGPWTFNEPDKLPADFAKIPEGSDKDNVLASISGTAAADEAIIENEIPQTAKIDRKTATVKVEYDGDPKLEAIEGTNLSLVLNSNLTVLKEEGGTFYALDNGVWFTAGSAKGPWKVSDKRPAQVDRIPAKSPAYNARFVYIYEATDTYVVAGYTGGYLGSYVQGDPVIVFGTGFYYTPWYGAIYYPRPATWGFNFCYNPYTGWSMGVGFNVGFLTIGFGFGGVSYGAGWFGPPLYMPPYRPPYYGGGYYGGYRPGRPGGNYGNNVGNNIGSNNNININVDNSHNNLYRPSGNNSRPGVTNRPQGNRDVGKSYRPDNKSGPGNRGGVGDNRGGIGDNRGGIGDNRGGVGDNRGGIGDNRGGAGNNGANDRRSAPPATRQPDNVFADRDGNVYQRDNKGSVNQRDNKSGSWKPVDNPATTRNVQNDANLRDRGNQQMGNRDAMQRSSMPAARPAAPAARPAAPMGGGGRGGLRGNF